MTLTVQLVGETEWDDYAQLFSTVFKSKTSAKALRRKLQTDFGAGPGAAFLVRDGQRPVASIGAQFLRFYTQNARKGEAVVHLPGVSALKEYRGGETVSLVFAAVEAYAQKRGCKYGYGVAHAASLGPVTKLHGYQHTGTYDIFTTSEDHDDLEPSRWRMMRFLRKVRRHLAALTHSEARLTHAKPTFEECGGVHDAQFLQGLRARGATSLRIAGHDLLVNPGATLRVAALPNCPADELAEIVRLLRLQAHRWGIDQVQFMVEHRAPVHSTINAIVGPPRGSLYAVWKEFGDNTATTQGLQLCPAHTDHF